MMSRLHWVASIASGVLAVAGLSIVVTAPVMAQTANGQKVSKAVATPLKAAQDALKAGNLAEYQSKIEQMNSLIEQAQEALQ